MSKYTTELRFLCESEAGLTESKGFNSIESILEESAPKIFNFSFPIFDESYRLPLEIKILRYYYTREICEETVGLWKLRLQNRLNLIMPYYNQLYESELIKFNPLYDVDLTTDHERNNSSTEETEAHGSETGKSVTEYSENVVVDTDTTDSNVVNTTVDNDTTNRIVRDKDTTGTEAQTGKTTNDDGTTSKTDTHELNSEGITKTTDNTTTVNNTNTPNTTVTVNGSDSTNTTSTNESWDLYSDTPQGGVVGLEGAWDSVGGNAYLTNARKKTESGQGTQTGTNSGTTTTTGTITDSGTNVLDGEEQTTISTEKSTVTDFTETIAKEENRTNNITSSGTEDETVTETGTNDTLSSQTENGTGTIDTTQSKTGQTETNTTRNTTNTGNTEITGLENYIQHVLGKSPGKTYSTMLKEFRDTFLNIDRMVINDLSNLFFGLW